MAAVTLALVGFFAFLILRVTAPQMTPLFTDLSYEDSSAIVKDLERQGVAYELRNDGGTIMVPKDRVARLRMSLAGEGLPKGGGVGYEIFDKSDALGTTNFIQNINNLRAHEGELARTTGASTALWRRVCTWYCRSGRYFHATRWNRPRRSCSRFMACSSRNRCAPFATWSRPPSTGSNATRVDRR